MGSFNLKKRVLLVDDERPLTQMLTMLFETRGYDVAVSHSSQQALDILKTTCIDIILLDLVLPDQDGHEFCRILKQHKKYLNIPIIIISGKNLSNDIVEGLYLGADDYLAKPFEYEELVARMEAVLRRTSMFHEYQMRGQKKIMAELKEILLNEEIIPFFQPIFLLKPFQLYGLEVLTRPQSRGLLNNPELLFKAAIQFGVYHELEVLSWRKALEYATQYISTEKLFLNCNPYLIESPKFLTVKSLFDSYNIKINNVILELTERSAISKADVFFDHVNQYRDYGFNFAIDDFGGGYASVESIIQTKPEVIKIDRKIITNIQNDSYKKSLVNFILSFCRENQIMSIAEGVETKEEFELLRTLGIDAVQGYFLYRPSNTIDFTNIGTVVQQYA